MNGAELIAAERRRQVEAEGWTPEHDDEHQGNALAWAGRCYIDAATIPAGQREFVTRPPLNWPWDASWWKPDIDPIRNLVKAGALIAAEIDRLQRAAPPQDGEGRMSLLARLRAAESQVERYRNALEALIDAASAEADSLWEERETPAPEGFRYPIEYAIDDARKVLDERA